MCKVSKRKATEAPAGNHPSKKKVKLCLLTPPPSSFNVANPSDFEWKTSTSGNGNVNVALNDWTEGCVEPRWIQSLIGVDVVIPGYWVGSPAASQRGFIDDFRDDLFTVYFPLLGTNCTISYNDLKTIIDYSQFRVEPHHLPPQTPTVLKLG